jgi:hypothetical protein
MGSRVVSPGLAQVKACGYQQLLQDGNLLSLQLKEMTAPGGAPLSLRSRHQKISAIAAAILFSGLEEQVPELEGFSWPGKYYKIGN